MVYDDSGRDAGWFELPEPNQTLTLPKGMSSDQVVDLLRGYRSQGMSADQVMDALREQGITCFPKAGIEEFLKFPSR